MRIWILILGWLVISCNHIEDCTISSSQDYAVVRFFWADSTPKTPRPVGFDLMYESNEEFYLSVVEDTFRITYQPYPPLNDTIRNDTTIMALILPFDPADTMVHYSFETDSMDFHVSMIFSKNFEIYYHDCPPAFNYELDSAYGVGFDSVALINPTIDSQIPVNIELYL